MQLQQLAPWQRERLDSLRLIENAQRAKRGESALDSQAFLDHYRKTAAESGAKMTFLDSGQSAALPGFPAAAAAPGLAVDNFAKMNEGYYASIGRQAGPVAATDTPALEQPAVDNFAVINARYALQIARGRRGEPPLLGTAGEAAA